jgi:hypothetical protein
VIWLAQTGCGTLFSGTSQDVRLTTEPREASVAFYTLQGERVAHTPDASRGPLQVPRPKRHLGYVTVVSHEDHCPSYSISKVNTTPGYMAEAFLLAIPFIQVIGFAGVSVDDRTGGCCAIEPVVVELEEADRCE